MRLAWFSPMPPARTGVAAVSADLVRALQHEHDVDVFADLPVRHDRSPLRSVHEFVWLHAQRPYDLTVYQLGNSGHHDFQWPYVFRYPGLAVLHDVHLHHARAACLLRQRRPDDYRAELRANHPDVPGAVAELAVAGFSNPVYYRWPMTRLVAASSRLTAAHGRLLAERLRRETPGAHVAVIRLGHGTKRDATYRREARRKVRADRGIDPDAIVFGVFGGLTEEKRVPIVLRAFAALRAELPAARLMLVGAPAAPYDVRADVRARGLDTPVILTGYLRADDDLDAHIAACDIALTLRWPTAHEVSGPWLRALAAGIPTIITELEHLSDVPAWRASDAGLAARPCMREPVTVSIDLANEEAELRLAMRGLATDERLRERLGMAGQEYWLREHSPAGMVDDYRRVLALAVTHEAPRPLLPDHLVDRADARLRSITGEFSDRTTMARVAALLDKK